MLAKLKHPSIVGMKSAWADSTYVYMVLDYALSGDLLNFLKKQGKIFIHLEFLIIV